jgi:hypothetical protein
MWLGLLLAAGFLWIGHVAGRRARLSSRANWRLTGLATIATIGWLTATWTAASSGVLSQFDRRPPPFALLFLAILAVAPRPEPAGSSIDARIAALGAGAGRCFACRSNW